MLADAGVCYAVSLASRQFADTFSAPDCVLAVAAVEGRGGLQRHSSLNCASDDLLRWLGPRKVSPSRTRGFIFTRAGRRLIFC